MNTKSLKMELFQEIAEFFKGIQKMLEPALMFIVLICIWCFGPQLIQGDDQTIGMVDQSMWVLIVFSMISLLMACAISWWLLQHFWTVTGLPNIKQMVSQFNTIQPWQQLSFFWASFALLLLAATGCLLAIC